MSGKREPRLQFQWRGWTKEGVSRWAGTPKGPPEWFSKIFLYYGLIAGTAGLGTLGYCALHPDQWHHLSVLVIVGGIHGLAFGLPGRWMLNMRRKLLRLKSAEELAQEFGSDQETVKRLAEQHSIRPQLNVNDVNLYNPQEFYASQILLRAASAPVAPETLLRAAEPTAPQVVADTLLRPIEPDAAPQAQVQSLAPLSNTEPDDVAVPYVASAKTEQENTVQELRR